MRRPFIRAVLLSYPSAWRRRYGEELEQLILDCGQGRSLIATTRLFIDVTATGLVQRLRSCGSWTRIVAVACLCAGAGTVIDVATVTSADTLDMGGAHIGMIWLAPNAFLPHGVTILHAPAWAFPASFQPLPPRITVQMVPGTSRVIGISGPPSSTVMNPNTAQIVSVRPER